MHALLLLISTGMASPPAVHSSSGTQGVEAIQRWLTAHPEGIELTIDSGSLEVYTGSCVENPHYWSVMGGDQKVYLSFGPEVHTDHSLEAPRQNFRYANLHFKLPLGDGWVTGINNFTPFRTENGGITIEDYVGGRITLLIEQPAVELSAIQIEDPRCKSEDAHGGLPKGCTAFVHDMQIPTSIRIDLPLPVPGEGCSREEE
jgi:hypothetical protein